MSALSSGSTTWEAEPEVNANTKKMASGLVRVTVVRTKVLVLNKSCVPPHGGSRGGVENRPLS